MLPALLRIPLWMRFPELFPISAKNFLPSEIGLEEAIFAIFSPRFRNIIKNSSFFLEIFESIDESWQGNKQSYIVQRVDIRLYLRRN